MIHSTDLDHFSKGQNGSYGHITSKKSSGFHSVNQFTHKAPPLRVPSWPPFLPPSPPYHLTTHGGTSKAAVECLAQVQVGFSTVVHSPYHSLWTNLTTASMVLHNQGSYSQNVTGKLVRPQIFVISPQMSWKNKSDFYNIYDVSWKENYPSAVIFTFNFLQTLFSIAIWPQLKKGSREGILLRYGPNWMWRNFPRNK